MNSRYSLNPASTMRMAAQRPSQEAMHWPGILCCAPCECATAIRRGARRVGGARVFALGRQKRGSWGLLRQVPVLLFAFLFASGCGQKGPLYLPGDPSEIRTNVPRQDERRTEEKDEDEEEASQDEN